MSSIIFNTWKAKDGNDWAAGAASAYKGMLVTASYTPDPDHDFPNATGLAANEITGGSYARQNIANRAKTKDNAGNKYDHSADNPIFSGLASAAPRYLIIYRAVTADTDHQLVCCLDLGAGISISGDFMAKLGGGVTSGVAFQGA